MGHRFSFIIIIMLFCSLNSADLALSMGYIRLERRWIHYESGGSFISGPASLNPENDKIVFSSPITGHGDIYRIDLEGNKIRRLTKSNDYEGEPRFSPDGKKIVYVREKKGEGGRIFLMDSNGKNQIQISTGDSCYDSTPVFSHDGKRLVFLRELRPYHREIFICNLDGNLLQNVTKNNESNLGAPAFSLKDEDVLFFADTPSKKIAIKKINLITHKVMTISYLSSEASDFNFSWDASKVVFVSYNYNEKSYQIFDMDISTKFIKQLTNLRGFKHSPSYSFDGSRILFIYKPQKEEILVIIDADGTKLKKIAIIGPYQLCLLGHNEP